MWTGEKKISLERLYNSEMADKLTRTGHDITIPVNSLEFGRGQIILRDDDGTLCGATEPGPTALWPCGSGRPAVRIKERSPAYPVLSDLDMGGFF